MTEFAMISPLIPPRGIKEPLDVPPAVRQPTDWRKLRATMRTLRDPSIPNEDKVDAGLEFFSVVGGLGGERTFRRFLNQPAGQQLVRNRPDLIRLLDDREALAAMPEGSLGRAYLAFAEENGFVAEGLVNRNREAHNNAEEDGKGNDPIRNWFWDRFTVTHDLWHVLSGCPTTGDGEVRLLAFSFAQTPQSGYFLLLGLIGFGRIGEWRFHLKQWKSWRRGRRASDLIIAPWESLLAWPLDEVRRCYGIEVVEV